MKKWRMRVILALLLCIVLMVIWIALGPVVRLSHEMARSSEDLAVFRPWILCMAWIILAGVAVAVAILFLGFLKIYLDSKALFSLPTFMSLKGAAKALEVSEIVDALLILLLFLQKVRSIMLVYLIVGFVFALLASQSMRLVADMVDEGMRLQDDVKWTI